MINVCLNRLEKHVRDIVHKAFWDKLEEELKQEPPNYGQMVSLIADLKQVSGIYLLNYIHCLRAPVISHVYEDVPLNMTFASVSLEQRFLSVDFLLLSPYNRTCCRCSNHTTEHCEPRSMKCWTRNSSDSRQNTTHWTCVSAHTSLFQC